VVNAVTGQTIYTPPPPYDVPPLMAELVAWPNTTSDIHPVLVSGIAQFQLVHIHPFVDGNGRTSRLLSTLCLYRTGYDFKRLFSISEYYDRNRTGFYTALQSVREHEMDLTGWLDYFVEGLATQMDEVTERGKRAIRRDVIAREYALNPRQVLAVGHLLERNELWIEELEVLCSGVNRRTLQRDLRDLVQQGVVKSIGAARAVRYVLQIKGLQGIATKSRHVLRQEKKAPVAWRSRRSWRPPLSYAFAAWLSTSCRRCSRSKLTRLSLLTPRNRASRCTRASTSRSTATR
jgi:Fic family protein